MTEATTRRRLLRRGIAVAGLVGVTGCTSDGDGGDDDGGGDEGGGGSDDGFRIDSLAVEDGGSYPAAHTCDGDRGSPPLSFANVPDGAATLAVLLRDPDAPGGTFTHWLVWNLPADVGSVPAGLPNEPTLSEPPARQGANDAGGVGYAGPCPPAGDDPHTYRFTAHAVDGTLSVAAGVDAGTLSDALEGRTLATAELAADYGR